MNDKETFISSGCGPISCFMNVIYNIYINSLLKIRLETKAAYSQNAIKGLKTYNIIQLHAVHKYVIYNDNYKHTK